MDCRRPAVGCRQGQLSGNDTARDEVNGYGQSGTGTLHSPVLRHARPAAPNRLRKCLASVPGPAPTLLTGLPSQADIRLVADDLRTDILKCGQPGGQGCKPYGRPVTGGTWEWRQIYAVRVAPR